MGTPKSLPYLKAEEILADGEWHPFPDVLREVMNAVPPHIAFHQAEYSRVWGHRRRHGTADPIPPRKYLAGRDDSLVRVGRRQVAYKVLSGDRFVRDRERGLIMMRPSREVPLTEKARSERSRKAMETLKKRPDYQEMVKRRGAHINQLMLERYGVEGLYKLRSEARRKGIVRKNAKPIFEEFNGE